MLEMRLAQTADEREAIYRFRYSIYVEEMGRYQAVADHERRRLADPEDEWSWLAYAHDGTQVVASTRVTWGGHGFSPRQVSQYGLAPFLDELPAELMAVGERTMISPARRGTELLEELGTVLEPLNTDHDVRIVFGACEPHLISYYCRYQRPFGARNINSADAGLLIPLVCFVPGPEALVGLGDGPGMPRCVQAALDETGTVRSPLLSGPAGYRDDVHDALVPLAAALFEGLADDELDRCIARSNIICCAEGDRVLKKGGAARNVFVVLSGALEVSDADHAVAVLLPGGVFGESAYLLEQPRAHDVDALCDDTRILSLSERTLRNLTAEDPSLAAKLLGNVGKILCRRLLPASGC